MRDSHAAAPGAGTPGRPNQSIAESFGFNGLRLINQEPLPIGGFVGDIVPGDGIGDFLTAARIGEMMQAIFSPQPIHRRGWIEGDDLLAVHRVHSEACLSIVRGFDRFLLVTAIPALGRR